MGMLSRLIGTLKTDITGKRPWTPQEVRELIDRREMTQARQAADSLSPHLRERGAERACLLGEIAFLERRDEEADAAFREALSAVPGMPFAHYGLSLLLAERGDFDAATKHAQFALTAQPLEPRFLSQIGYCHLSMGNLQVAENPLRKATQLKPDEPATWNNLGIVLRGKGHFQEACDCFRRAVDLRPTFAAAQNHLERLEKELVSSKQSFIDPLVGLPKAPAISGALLESVRQLEEAGNLHEAINECERVALENPASAAPVIELHRLYDRLGDPQSGIDVLEAHVSRHPDQSEARAALGLAHARARQHAPAKAHLLKALQDAPDDVELLMALGQTHSGQGEYAKALAVVQRARELAPDDEVIFGQCAAALSNACHYEEALEICEQIRANGKEIACYGSVLTYLGRFDEARAWLDRTLDHQPSDPNLRFQRAQIHLMRHEFAQGWDDYAFRGLSVTKHFRVLPFTHWRGEPLNGKKIVVLAEQGLGDQVMFASCLPDLLKLEPAELVVEVIGRIAPTLERSFPQCRIIATKQDSRMNWVRDCGQMDYFVPLGDLPQRFRRSVDEFPRHDGYLVPDPTRVAYWKSKLAQRGPGPYIGLSWRGGTEVTRTSVRSVAVSELAELTKSARGATFVCLQYGNVTEGLEEARQAGLEMAYWPEAIENLDEFAALIKALDLVITVCNTTVHYAGAIAKPVWVLSPQIPEWRYGIKGDSLPWYPSSRMFRQTVPGQWSPTIARICQELSTWCDPSEQSARTDERE